MTPRTVLVVEDNPITRRTTRVALESGGYRVVEAADAQSALELLGREAPDLVLQDLLLPDMDGAELARRIRAHPQGLELPILACSGLAFDDPRRLSADFVDFVPKHLEPNQLLQAIETYLPSAPARSERRGLGRLVLVADDDALQRKLLRVRLVQLGFEVDTAENGAEALERLRSGSFAAVVSDCLMPRLDGFHLCQAIRVDSRLRHLPVVLATSTYLEKDDAALAKSVGAHALVGRTPDFAAVIDALFEALNDGARNHQAADAAPLAQEYSARLAHQVEKQATLNQTLSQRLARQAAEMAAITGIAEMLARSPSSEDVLPSLLDRCLHAGGISTGALYVLKANGGLALSALSGYEPSSEAEVRGMFGRPELFERVMREGRAVALPSDPPFDELAKVLQASRATAAVVVPIVAHGNPVGVVLMASQRADWKRGEWIAFASAIALQIGQALALARAVGSMARSEARYRGLFEASREAMLLTDSGGRIVDANAAAAGLTGRSGRELIGVAVADLVAGQVPETASLQSAESEDRVLEARDGTERRVRLSASRIESDLWLYILQDVTRERQLQQQMAQSEKLAAMGELLAGVAHELNNPLSVVLGQVHLLRRAASDGPLVERADKIASAADRCARIVKNFLALARQQPPERRRFTLNQVVTDAMELLTYPLRIDGIEVSLELAPELPALLGDAHQLQQVVVNLATNAHHSMRDSPRRELRICTSLLPGDEGVLLEVIDSGPGIPAAIQRRIFDPFFTTKATGEGTGLGLSMCRGIVESHGGRIRVENVAGGGAAFRVTLPLRGEAVESRAPEAPADAAPTAPRSRILVVDDEISMREMLVDMLELEGHEVKTAGDGRAALIELETGSYDLLLSDMRMPRMDGPALFLEVERRWPALARRFVFMTGDSLNDDTRRFLERVPTPNLNKPFDLEAVRSVVARVLATD